MKIGKDKRGLEQRPDVQVVPPIRQPQKEPVRVAPEREKVPAGR